MEQDGECQCVADNPEIGGHGESDARQVAEQRGVDGQDGDAWLGYLDEFPDYMTQGESLDDLKAHLTSLYQDLTSGEIPCVKRRGELEVA